MAELRESQPALRACLRQPAALPPPPSCMGRLQLKMQHTNASSVARVRCHCVCVCGCVCVCVGG